MKKQVPKAKVPKSVKPGIYQHYKGDLYLILGVARNANQDGERGVIYIPLSLHENEVPMLTYRRVDGVDGFFVPREDGTQRFTFLYPVNVTEMERPIIKG